MTRPDRVLSVIACGAGPASDVGKLVKLAQERGWTVQVIATPAALPFLDITELKAMTGSPVRSSYRSPGEPRSPKADAVIVAPATYNTICKCAQGISDTYALGVLAEAIGIPVPVVMVPFVNTALAARRPFERSVVNSSMSGSAFFLDPTPSSRTRQEPALTTSTISLGNSPWMPPNTQTRTTDASPIEQPCCSAPASPPHALPNCI